MSKVKPDLNYSLFKRPYSTLSMRCHLHDQVVGVDNNHIFGIRARPLFADSTYTFFGAPMTNKGRLKILLVPMGGFRSKLLSSKICQICLVFVSGV